MRTVNLGRGEDAVVTAHIDGELVYIRERYIDSGTSNIVCLSREQAQLLTEALREEVTND